MDTRVLWEDAVFESLQHFFVTRKEQKVLGLID